MPSAIELRPFLHEAEVALSEDFTLRLTINFRTIDRMEALFGKGMDEILGELNSKASVMTKVLWGVTREHHSDLTLDQVAAIQFEHEHRLAVMAALGDLIRATFHIGEPAKKKTAKSPAKPKTSGGASRASSGSGAPRG